MNTSLQALLAVHVACGVTAAVTGVGTMRAIGEIGAHPRRGHVYLWALAGVSVTGLAMAGTQWSRLWHLAAVGGTAMLCAVLGMTARRCQSRQWLPVHVLGMSGSYVAMLTAFYVDNGPRLPLWNMLPAHSFWILPSAVVGPVIFMAVRRNCLRPGQRMRAGRCLHR